MSFSNIENQLTTAKAYKAAYLQHIENQRSKIQGEKEIFHDSADLNPEHHEKLKHYDNTIENLQTQKSIIINQQFKGAMMLSHVAVLAGFVSLFA